MSERCKYERHDKSFERHRRQIEAQKRIDRFNLTLDDGDLRAALEAVQPVLDAYVNGEPPEMCAMAEALATVNEALS